MILLPVWRARADGPFQDRVGAAARTGGTQQEIEKDSYDERSNDGDDDNQLSP